MYNGRRVSVVFSTFNERDTIRRSIIDAFSTGVVDEVIVVNNNAVEGTDEEVRGTGALLFHESRQGYGWGYRKGLEMASGDLVVMSEPDGTFRQKDILKLLVYSDDFDVVFGTRTTSATILEGANMGFFLKWGNWFIAKIIEFGFGSTHLSDVGCTVKLIKRSALSKIKGAVHRSLRSGGLFVLVQPNFALCPREYFDDYTHKKVFTDKSLVGLLRSKGFELVDVKRRFLPFSMKSRLPRFGFLVWLYLRSPWKPWAGQMLVVVRKK